MAVCYHCQTPIPPEPPLGRSSVCSSCGRDLRVCRNCSFYSPGSQWDCRETIGEPVREKERANFCEYFSPSGRGPGEAKPAEVLKRFNALFND
ncbi:MAG: hypothetical protein LBQ61_09305 [Spirochaetales bacterium]|nr:hypothetical protein [Spirochaetales bacterium]